MKTTKMSLATIQGKLSRAEMKKIMAGSGGAFCKNKSCSGQDPLLGSYSGTCSSLPFPQSGCGCKSGAQYYADSTCNG
jgi:hypothetical protein